MFIVIETTVVEKDLSDKTSLPRTKKKMLLRPRSIHVVDQWREKSCLEYGRPYIDNLYTIKRVFPCISWEDPGSDLDELLNVISSYSFVTVVFSVKYARI